MPPDARTGSRSSGEGSAPSPPPSLPELSQRLELRERLGMGGFAVVHRAHDRAIGRDVAVKLLHQERAGNAASLTRFYREGELVARLEHPGIVRVHAAGTFRGQPCLVYELVEEARPLAEVLPELPVTGRLEALRDLARALGWAHAHGVVHRDVKPENALVDAEGRVRLTDFGLAAAGDLERLTRSGAVLGTPYYMAPEQLTGSRDEIGPQSDVWALGVMLYQALTDRLPFTAQSMAALAVEVVTGKFEPPRSVSGDVPRDLEAVCLQALRPRPADRYPHAGAFADDLERVLAGGRPLATRRRRVPWRALGLALIPLPPLGAAALLLAGRPPGPDPGSEPTSAAPVVPRTPGEALDALASGADPWARGAAAEAWLAAHPGHPRAPEARRLSAAARGEAPLRVFPWAPERVRAPDGSPYVPTEQERVVAVLEGGEFASAGARERRLRRGDAVTGVELRAWEDCPATALLPHAGGLFVANPDAIRWLVPAGDRQEARRELRPSGPVRGLAVAPQRGLLAAALGGYVVVWRLEGGPPLVSLEATQEASCVRFSPDERLLVAGGVRARTDGFAHGSLVAWATDGFERRWETETLEGFYCLAFTSDGRTLAAGTRGCLVLLLEPDTGAIRASLAGVGVEKASLGQVAHDYPVKGLVISPDGARMYTVAAARDKEGGQLAVWELPSGRALGPMRETAPHRPASLAIDASGRVLVIGTIHGDVLSWATPP